MTAIATRPLATPDDALLRFVLRADATVTSFLGLSLAVLADHMARLTGFTPTQQWVIGASVVGYGALLFGLAAVEDLRMSGIGVTVGNLILGGVALIAVLAGWFPLTGFGVAITVAAAATMFVLAFVFAGLQNLGVRRLRA